MLYYTLLGENVINEDRLTLDSFRLASVKRISESSKSVWALNFWTTVQTRLERNMRTKTRYFVSGGSERPSNDTKHVGWNHF